MGIAQPSLEDQAIHCLILGLRVQIDCVDDPLRQLLVANFGAMSVPESGHPADLRYEVARRARVPPFLLRREGRDPLAARNPGDLVYLLEKSLILDLQRVRADLLFLHAAAVELNDGVALLVAESGGGKSTTTWGLLHHGFGYLSDELSPIDLQTMQVLPYPHALCLKAPPPPQYPLPDGALDLGRTIHVPVRAMPRATTPVPRPLAGIFFVRYVQGLATPELARVSPGEASARLFIHTLNARAHPNLGLDATVRMAKHAPGFVMSTGTLSASCDAIRDAMEVATGRRTTAASSANPGS